MLNARCLPSPLRSAAGPRTFGVVQLGLRLCGREGYLRQVISHSDDMREYWDQGFRQAEQLPGSFYDDQSKWPPILRAAHERRIALLDSLPIGDVRDKVCVDFGVGRWGFACIYPRLQACRMAIGFDISPQALRMSQRISRDGNFPYGDNYQYLVSRGDHLELENASVDIFFAGESIEHVDHTEAFLDEVHRVLRTDGLFILTTPNADAYFYRLRGERYCFNGEHISLMSYAELQTVLAPRFETLVAKGFNASFFRLWDDRITDPRLIEEWAAYFEDRPDMATGVVVMTRKRADFRPAHYTHQYYHHSSPAFRYSGDWLTVPLFGPVTGALGHPKYRSRVRLEFEGNGLLVQFWKHGWSGVAELEIDGTKSLVDLYSPVPGMYTVHLGGLSTKKHQVTLCALDQAAPASNSREIIWHQMIAYRRELGVSPHRME